MNDHAMKYQRGSVELVGNAVKVSDAASFFFRGDQYHSRITLLGKIAEDVGVEYLNFKPKHKIELTAIAASNIRAMIGDTTRTFMPPNILAIHNYKDIFIPLSGRLEYDVETHIDPFTMRSAIGEKMTFKGTVSTMIFGSMALNKDLELRLAELSDNPILPSEHTESFRPVDYLMNTACTGRFPKGFFAVYAFSDVEPVYPNRRDDIVG